MTDGQFDAAAALAGRIFLLLRGLDGGVAIMGLALAVGQMLAKVPQDVGVKALRMFAAIAVAERPGGVRSPDELSADATALLEAALRLSKAN